MRTLIALGCVFLLSARMITASDTDFDKDHPWCLVDKEEAAKEVEEANQYDQKNSFFSWQGRREVPSYFSRTVDPNRMLICAVEESQKDPDWKAYMLLAEGATLIEEAPVAGFCNYTLMTTSKNKLLSLEYPQPSWSTKKTSFPFTPAVFKTSLLNYYWDHTYSRGCLVTAENKDKADKSVYVARFRPVKK